MARARCPCGTVCDVDHVAPGERFTCPACGRTLVRSGRKESDTPPGAGVALPGTGRQTPPPGAAPARQHTPTAMPAARPVVPPPVTPPAELIVGGYRVTRRIKAGGMGVVYEAIQLSLNRKVALKVLSEKVAKKPTATERFERETQILVALRHPHIVAILDRGDYQGSPYYVMDYIDGPRGDGNPLTLEDIVKEGPLAPEQACAYAIQVGEALAYAHSRGIVHRDIKPSNIMIDIHGKAQVLDFGIAQFKDMADFDTDEQQPMGTADFMAPEQGTDAANADARADVYSLGVVLYLLLTRKLPKGAFHPPSKLVPSLDARWDEVILNALRQDRDERIPTMPAFVAALRELGDRSGSGTGSALGRRGGTEIPDALPPNPVEAREVIASLRKSVSLSEVSFRTQAAALGEALLARTESAPRPPQSFVAYLKEAKELRSRLAGNQVMAREIKALADRQSDIETRLNRYQKDLRDLQAEISQQWGVMAERAWKLQQERKIPGFDEVFQPIADFEASVQALEARIKKLVEESEQAGFLGKMAVGAKKLAAVAELNVKKMGRGGPLDEVGRRVLSSGYGLKTSDAMLDRFTRLGRERDEGRQRLERTLERLNKEKDDCIATLRGHGVTTRAQERLNDLTRESAQVQERLDGLFVMAAEECLDRKAQVAPNDPVIVGLTEEARQSKQALERVRLQLRSFEGQVKADAEAKRNAP